MNVVQNGKAFAVKMVRAAAMVPGAPGASAKRY